MRTMTDSVEQKDMQHLCPFSQACRADTNSTKKSFPLPPPLPLLPYSLSRTIRSPWDKVALGQTKVINKDGDRSCFDCNSPTSMLQLLICRSPTTSRTKPSKSSPLFLFFVLPPHAKILIVESSELRRSSKETDSSLQVRVIHARNLLRQNLVERLLLYMLWIFFGKGLPSGGDKLSGTNYYGTKLGRSHTSPDRIQTYD